MANRARRMTGITNSLFARDDDWNAENEALAEEMENDSTSAEEEEEAPILSSFYDKATDIRKTEDQICEVLTGFNKKEFEELFETVEDDLVPVGRGRRCTVAEMDQFMITLNWCKAYQTYSALGLTMGLADSVIKPLPLRTMRRCIPALNEAYIEPLTKTECRNKEIAFRYFDDSALTTWDCSCFAMQNPGGDIQKGFVSRKKPFHHSKFLSGHIANGLLVFRGRTVRGGIHDMKTMREERQSVIDINTKLQHEMRLVDRGHLHTRYPSQWISIMDKGFIGAENIGIRALIPAKKKRGVRQTQIVRTNNRRISSDRQFCENWYGRGKVKFRIFADKCRQNLEEQNVIHDFMSGVINFDIMKRPLSNEDGTYYKNYISKLVRQAKKRKNDKKDQNRRYYQKRRRLLNGGEAPVVVNNLPTI